MSVRFLDTVHAIWPTELLHAEVPAHQENYDDRRDHSCWRD